VNSLCLLRICFSEICYLEKKIKKSVWDLHFLWFCGKKLGNESLSGWSCVVERKRELPSLPEPVYSVEVSEKMERAMAPRHNSQQRTAQSSSTPYPKTMDPIMQLSFPALLYVFSRNSWKLPSLKLQIGLNCTTTNMKLTSEVRIPTVFNFAPLSPKWVLPQPNASTF